MKNYAVIVFAFLASVLIWLLSNLSKQTADIVSVPVMVESNIPGHALSASDQVEISAAVRTTGYKLISLHSRRRIVRLVVDQQFLASVGGDYYELNAADMFRYTMDLFGSGVEVQSFVTTGVTLRFPGENFKKVAVRPVSTISFNPQYMAIGDMRVSPDSVLVYGEPSRLEGVDYVLTKVISHSGVKRSISGVVKLDAPAGTRAEVAEAAYSMDVTRFVEVRSNAVVTVRNLPSGRDLAVFPSEIEVVAKYAFPLADKTTALPEFYVDYAEFARSSSGKCLIHFDDVPYGIVDLKTDPQVCDCVLTR